MPTEIRKIYSNNIVVVDSQPDDELIELKKNLNELQKKMDILKKLGVEYCECKSCNMPFMNEAQKIKHCNEYHTARWSQRPYTMWPLIPSQWLSNNSSAFCHSSQKINLFEKSRIDWVFDKISNWKHCYSQIISEW